MVNPKNIFNGISYLQYPLMAIALVLYVPFTMSLIEKNPDWSMLNYALIIFGVALSFSTLQDTKKTQNKMSLKIWQHPVKGKIMLSIIAVTAFILIGIGFVALLYLKANQSESVSVGLIVLGIGMIGMLKTAIEMFENHKVESE